MTPWEFQCVIDGAMERRHYEQETVATMTANLINVHIAKGRQMRPDNFYRRPNAPPPFADSKAFTEYMKRRRLEREE